jgi:hypothetical protein
MRISLQRSKEQISKLGLFERGREIVQITAKREPILAFTLVYKVAWYLFFYQDHYMGGLLLCLRLVCCLFF